MSEPSRSLQPRTNRRKKDCPCAAIKDVPRGWNRMPCPFRKMKPGEVMGEEVEWVRTLVCDCGKEVGEIVFAGEERVGEWRVR